MARGFGSAPFGKMNHTRYFIGPRVSVQFHTILAKAEIQQVTIAAGGKAGHEFNRYTFHSLRHSYVSELANAGIAPDVRQLLSGHADEKSHAVYTHTKLETLRKAIETLPRLQ